jgi:hypothetical protein
MHDVVRTWLLGVLGAVNMRNITSADVEFRLCVDVEVLLATADKQGKATDVTIWWASFMEEREVLVSAKCL